MLSEIGKDQRQLLIQPQKKGLNQVEANSMCFICLPVTEFKPLYHLDRKEFTPSDARAKPPHRPAWLWPPW
ncbi:hypothetical protein JCM39068_23250 [Desulfocastanea catecholica]